MVVETAEGMVATEMALSAGENKQSIKGTD